MKKYKNDFFRMMTLLWFELWEKIWTFRKRLYVVSIGDKEKLKREFTFFRNFTSLSLTLRASYDAPVFKCAEG